MSDRIELIPAFERREELIPLYEEYAEMLVRTDPVFSKSLDQQNYNEEIDRLEDKYAPPNTKTHVFLLLRDKDYLPFEIRSSSCFSMNIFVYSI